MVNFFAADVERRFLNSFKTYLVWVEAKNRWKDKQIYFIPHKTYKEDFFSVRGESGNDLRLPENAKPLH